MRISRPCYDKPHRCPGWAGGGFRYAKVTRCDNGRIPGRGEQALWNWRLHRCQTCGVVVLPYAVHLLSPSWWRLMTSLRRP